MSYERIARAYVDQRVDYQVVIYVGSWIFIPAIRYAVRASPHARKIPHRRYTQRSHSTNQYYGNNILLLVGKMTL